MARSLTPIDRVRNSMRNNNPALPAFPPPEAAPTAGGEDRTRIWQPIVLTVKKNLATHVHPRGVGTRPPIEGARRNRTVGCIPSHGVGVPCPQATLWRSSVQALRRGLSRRRESGRN